MENKAKTQQEIEKEMMELNEQFSEFLHTKGIVAKFKLAFSNMKESAKKQHEDDVANFKAIKEKSAEENKEFVEFLQTKGIKAKFKLVIENIKKGAANASSRTAEQIAKVKAQTQANINNARVPASTTQSSQNYTPELLSAEFNAFLKQKGLDSKYTVVIAENDQK